MKIGGKCFFLSENFILINMPDETTATQQTKVIKFYLSDFNSDDPQTWFIAVEIIFTANKSVMMKRGFRTSYSILTAEKLRNRDILLSQPGDRYRQAKERLVKVHGKSRTKQLMQLLNGTPLPINAKSSIILSSIQHLAGTNASSDKMKDIIQSLWVQKLPARTWEILAPSSNQSLTVQAEIADRLHETYETHQSSVAAVGSQPMQSNPDFAVLFDMMKAWQKEITEIKLERSHSPAEAAVSGQPPQPGLR